MITFKTPKYHWNYFLAIEEDLLRTSRYIEFAESNLQTYSIELSHILLSSSSEVDVVLKQLCNHVNPASPVRNINDYRAIITSGLCSFSNEEIIITRYGLSYKPWVNWQSGQNPDWWGSYNNVKHERNIYFQEANLQNTINSVGALSLTTVYYYKFAFQAEAGHEVSLKDTIGQLLPETSMIRINANYYHQSSAFLG